ncbi:hypothetical protein A9Q99_16900 [Gammaproteobacteria bacterium 45_16_T64]|nr:hypothetical protein A9Q99_16900 [Gammaproteobacteria bacterium 45_16_T64]
MSFKLLIVIGLIIVVISLFYSFFHLVTSEKTGNKVLVPLAFRVIASIAALILAYLQLSQKT